MSSNARCWPFALACLALAALARPAKVEASDAYLEQYLKKINGVQVYKSASSNNWYYTPGDIRLSKDKAGNPSFLLLRYNLPTTESYVVSDSDGNKKMASQGGILALEVTYDLDEKIQKKILASLNTGLKKGEKPATLSLMPLKKATINLEFVDIKKGEKVKITDSAPLNGNTIAFVVPLDAKSTDVIWDAFANPSSASIVSCNMAFEYTGYGMPLEVSVSGKWEDVDKITQDKHGGGIGFSFFRASADYEKTVEEMIKKGVIKISWKGGSPPGATPSEQETMVQKLVDTLTNKLIDAMFDKSMVSDVKGAEAAQEAAAKDSNPLTPLKKFFGFTGDVSFKVKRNTKKKSGSLLFQFTKQDIVTVSDIRYSRFGDGSLDIDPKDKKRFERHFRIVKPGDWSVVAPRVFVNADFTKYEKVAVDVTYADETAGVIFSQTQTSNMVPREWTKINTKLPIKTRFNYKYKVTALVKPGVFPTTVVPATKFETKEMESGAQFLLLDPSTWGGPQQVSLTTTLFGMEEVDAKNALIKIDWNNNRGAKGTKTYYLTAGGESKVWETYLSFDKVQPAYTATVSYTTNSGKKRGPYYLTMGKSTGADPDELTVILPELGAK